ncbi:MAG: hypothetical protein PHG71_06035 [Kiritimatiellae bacterium]|nr:hypothetical protein [Kiritimatiellia bacterium]MDD4622780.1 hypothetical protein [Kiritimatiellia bacterium]
MTRGNGMLITGSAGQCEIWTDDQYSRGKVGETSAFALRQTTAYPNEGVVCRHGNQASALP